MAELPPRFVRGADDLDDVLRDAKQRRCPHCSRFGTLIGHGFCYGYAEHGGDRIIRGRRLVCSKRGLRGGCGRTWAVRLGTVINGFIARTVTLSTLLCAVIGGVSVAAAWTLHVSTTLSLRSGYRLWHRLVFAQTHLRTLLHTTGPPPHNDSPQPLAQLCAHLQHALGTDTCVFAAFQLRFQRSALG